MNSISTINATNPAVQSSLPSQFSTMSSKDFVRIIFTELSHQDPFEPNDTESLLNQISSIRSIETDMNLVNQLQSIMTENQLTSASAMIGKFVGGLTHENIRVAGHVVSVIRAGDSIQLELDNGWILPLTGVESVVDPNALPETPLTG